MCIKLWQTVCHTKIHFFIYIGRCSPYPNLCLVMHSTSHFHSWWVEPYRSIVFLNFTYLRWTCHTVSTCMICTTGEITTSNIPTSLIEIDKHGQICEVTFLDYSQHNSSDLSSVKHVLMSDIIIMYLGSPFILLKHNQPRFESPLTIYKPCSLGKTEARNKIEKRL